MERNLSTAELRVLLAEREAKEKKDRQAYKDLVDETVQSLMPKVMALSKQLSETKEDIYKSFASILEMKAELYGIKSNQQSHTFTSSSGDTITIGYRVIESYDDTVDVGIEKVKSYLSTLAKDEESAALVNTVMKLLAKDRQGNLRASRVVELEQIAIDSKHKDFLEGIAIIKQAYKPKKTCRFVDVSKRDENGKQRVIPLSMSTVE